MKVKIMAAMCLLVFLGSCKLMDPDEKSVREMLKTFTAAIDRDDETMAKACLMDVEGYRILNPDAGARMDPESFIETVLAELIHSYRSLANFFRGREVKFKSLELGAQWFQYTGRQAFKDNTLTVVADGEEVDIPIKGIVRIGNQWRIVDLSGIEFTH